MHGWASPKHLPLISVLNRFHGLELKSLGDRGPAPCVPRLPAGLLFWLTSARAWNPALALASKRSSSLSQHPSYIRLSAAYAAASHCGQWLGHYFFDHVDDLLWILQVLSGTATDVALGHPLNCPCPWMCTWPYTHWCSSSCHSLPDAHCTSPYFFLSYLF